MKATTMKILSSSCSDKVSFAVLLLLVALEFRVAVAEKCESKEDASNTCTITADDDFKKDPPQHKRATFDDSVNAPYYDVHNCPSTPPFHYPMEWSANDVLGKWNPNVTEIPMSDGIFQGICIFDFQTEYEKAVNYWQSDVPFVIRNTPVIVGSVERWHQPGYVDELFSRGTRTYKVHKSPNYHFQYYSDNDLPSLPEGWTPPTEVSLVTFPEFQELATAHANSAPDDLHYYLYANGYWSPFGDQWDVFDDFPFFKTYNKIDLYQEIPHKDTQKLHCKFGMEGTMTNIHFDNERNTIVLMKGRKRYLLANPTQCGLLKLHEEDHPSSRQSSMHWTEFMTVKGLEMNEVVMQPGDALILPSYWFHSIIGLTPDHAQCNAWSIATMTFKQPILECGRFGLEGMSPKP